MAVRVAFVAAKWASMSTLPLSPPMTGADEQPLNARHRPMSASAMACAPVLRCMALRLHFRLSVGPVVMMLLACAAGRLGGLLFRLLCEGVQIFFGFQRCHAARTCGSDGLSVDVVHDIAGGEYAGFAGGRGVALEAAFHRDVAAVHG